MTNRKQNDVEAFLSDIDREWQLSLNEREYLKKIFNNLQKKQPNHIVCRLAPILK